MPTTGGFRHSLPEWPKSPQVPPLAEGGCTGVHVSPKRSHRLCRARSPCPGAGLQQDGDNTSFFISDTRRETQAEKDAQSCSSYMMLPKHPGLHYTALTGTSLFCFGATATAQGRGGTAATTPNSEGRGDNLAVLSVQPQAWGMSHSSHACENTPWI